MVGPLDEDGEDGGWNEDLHPDPGTVSKVKLPGAGAVPAAASEAARDAVRLLQRYSRELAADATRHGREAGTMLGADPGQSHASVVALAELLRALVPRLERAVYQSKESTSTLCFVLGACVADALAATCALYRSPLLAEAVLPAALACLRFSRDAIQGLPIDCTAGAGMAGTALWRAIRRSAAWCVPRLAGTLISGPLVGAQELRAAQWLRTPVLAKGVR